MKINVNSKVLELKPGFNVLVEKSINYDFIYDFGNVYGYSEKYYMTDELLAKQDNETCVLYLTRDIYSECSLKPISPPLKKLISVHNKGNECILHIMKTTKGIKFDFVIVSDILNRITPLLQIKLLEYLYKLNVTVLFIEENPLVLQLLNVELNWFISEEKKEDLNIYQDSIDNFNTK